MTEGFGDLVVFDASAVLAWLGQEPGWEYVDGLITSARICSVNFGEVLYKAEEEGSDPGATADDLVDVGLTVVDFPAQCARYFPYLREGDRESRRASREAGTPGKEIGQLSLADLCCLAYAWHWNYPVVTGDRYWLGLGLPLPIIDYRDPPEDPPL